MIWPFKRASKPEGLEESADRLRGAREAARKEREALKELLAQTLEPRTDG